MIEGLVSTIIPVHNRADLLCEAVASVLAQTHRPVEVIIVDEGSTDKTVHACDHLAAQYPQEIRVIHQANTGPGLAREAGRTVVRGEFIQYLDSDDVLLPRKFELQVAGLRAHPECGVAYGKTRYRHSDGRVEPEAWKGSGSKVATMFPSFLLSRWWDTPTPLYRSSICHQAGPWTNLRLEEDWEYDCRIAALGVRLYRCEEFVAEVRDHLGQRLCKGEPLDPLRLAQRAKSHALIYQHAQRAGLDEMTPEMLHFARELFLLSRQCGAAGLSLESRKLFTLARQAAGQGRARGWDFRLYKVFATILGWSSLGKLACYSDGFRR
jgi:glycosyltransferase involved in cell wall biosynthesis